jgi:hypothetical protein
VKKKTRLEDRVFLCGEVRFWRYRGGSGPDDQEIAPDPDWRRAFGHRAIRKAWGQKKKTRLEDRVFLCGEVRFWRYRGGSGPDDQEIAPDPDWRRAFGHRAIRKAWGQKKKTRLEDRVFLLGRSGSGGIGVVQVPMIKR